MTIIKMSDNNTLTCNLFIVRLVLIDGAILLFDKYWVTVLCQCLTNPGYGDPPAPVYSASVVINSTFAPGINTVQDGSPLATCFSAFSTERLIRAFQRVSYPAVTPHFQ